MVFWYHKRMERTEEIERLLEEEVRPALKSHGGSVVLVGINEQAGIVSVRLQGACRNCPFSSLTLKMGIEALLCGSCPWVAKVIAVE